MCIAILNQKGKLTKKVIRNCWYGNNDGAGLVYAENDRLHVHKELKDVKGFYQVYSDVRDRLPNANILLHFRIATHGRINIANCHPFLVNDKVAFIHNGIISRVEESDNFSDTYVFNQTILKSLPKNFMNNNAIIEMMAEYVGFSKLVFINNKGNCRIVNEELGIWDGENWFSNMSYWGETQKCDIHNAPKTSQGKDQSIIAGLQQPKNNTGSYYDRYEGLDNYEAQMCESCREHSFTVKYVADYNMDLCYGCTMALDYNYPKSPKKA